MKRTKKERHRSNPTYKCKKCGAIVDLRTLQWADEHAKLMMKHRVCFECLFWDCSENLPKNEYTYIYNGKIYVFAQDLYCTNNKVYIFTKDHKMLKGSIVCVGKVPDNANLTNNTTGHFVGKVLYNKKDDIFLCNAKGCWDRYRCAIYNREMEKGGPWNIVPDDYEVGGEGCISFIDIEKLKTFEDMINDKKIKL